MGSGQLRILLLLLCYQWNCENKITIEWNETFSQTLFTCAFWETGKLDVSKTEQTEL